MWQPTGAMWIYDIRCCCSYSCCTHLKAIVGPGAKLHLATLIVEGEPGDVDFARGLEDAGRHVEAAAIVTHHHVGGIGAVEALVGAASEVATHFLVSNGQGN